MCCCSSLAARRLPPARRCRRRRRSYYEAHQHGTGRDSWDTKGRRQPHGQIRIRRVGGRATRIRERPRGTLGWINRQTFDVLHLRTQDANFPMATGLAWVERRVVRGPTGPPCSSATGKERGKGLTRNWWYSLARGSDDNSSVQSLAFFGGISAGPV